MDPIVQCINEFWFEISRTYQDYTENLEHYLSDIRGVNYEQYRKGGYWSCLHMSDFMVELYSNERVNQKVTGFPFNSYEVFRQGFEPGYIYQFSVFNHEFVILFKSYEELYYIDYYVETGRGCRQIGVDEDSPQAARFERIKYEEILKYIERYLALDIDYHVKFHRGDALYERQLREELKDIRDYEMEYYYPSVNRFQLAENVTYSSIIRCLENSVYYRKNPRMFDKVLYDAYLVHFKYIVRGIMTKYIT